MERFSERFLVEIRWEMMLRKLRRLGPGWEYEGGGTFYMDANKYLEMIEDDGAVPYRRQSRIPAYLPTRPKYTKR